MEVEIFKTRRDFNKKFPSKTYICFWCGKLTSDENICIHCKRQANNLLNKGYKFSIQEESNETITIFFPIEIKEIESEVKENGTR